MRRYKGFICKLAFLGFLLIAFLFISSCTCGKESDKDGDDTDDDDDIDDDDSDDDDQSDDDVAEGWYVYTVDAEEYTGKYTSIAIDSNNKAHISYLYSGYGDRVKYATNKLGSWEISTIDSGGWRPSRRAIALDSNDNVHIGYRKEKGLKYVTNRSGAWQIVTVDSLLDGRTGEYASIALDSNDKVHISYFECGKLDDGACARSNIKYATNKSSSWQKSTLDQHILDTADGCETSIAVDTLDKEHISYCSWEGFIYATNVSGNWTKTVIKDYGGNYSSIAIDSSDNIHLAFAGGDSSGTIYYASNASGDWQIESINTGSYPSIAVDSQGKVHIAYRSDVGLEYATNKSGVWKKDTVITNEGAYSSIAVDSDGYVHISYCGADKHLKYATNRPPE